MPEIVKVWMSLPASKQLVLAAVLAATIFAFSMLARTASQPSMALLYSGLDASAAGEVVDELESMDIKVDVRNGAIFVPAGKRDSVRMKLAREGLPQQGQAGYELFEGLNGFSTTSEMFDVTYWRAMEGELARTITATPGVASARVHIAQERGKAFSRNKPKPKAVVTITMARGELSTGQANAVRYLVSSSVPGLSAEQVAVLDSDRGVILSPGEMGRDAVNQSDALMREQKMEADILDLLEARVGFGNARVQVALELDVEREAVTERVIDPSGRVISSRETTEVTETSSGANSTSVTVASNLPEGDVNGGGSQSNAERTQTDERTTYDLSEVRREREKLPGAIKRLSVAVLLNDIETVDANGDPVSTPRSDDELNALRELVTMAAGINADRGDSLTIQSLSFEPIVNDGVVAESNLMGDFVDRHLMTAIQVGVLAIVTLVLGLFVVKPLLATAPEEAPIPMMEQLTAAPSPQAPQPVDSFEALRSLANDKTDETADLIQSWLEEPEAAA